MLYFLIIFFEGFIVLLQFCMYAGGTISRDNLQMLNVTTIRNSRFENAGSFVLNSFIDMSIDQCILECGSRPGCKAVEYRYMAKHCSLRTAISTTVMAPGFLTVSGFAGTRQCGKNTTCSANEACDTGTETCIVKECGLPGIKRNVSGNRLALGSKIGYDCSEGDYEERICTDSGKWETVGQQFVKYPGLTCRDIRRSNSTVRSGFYGNRLNMKIYCDFDNDGGDWLAFQRRTDGSIDFYRNWQEYKTGFGYACGGEFWLGLENLHTILRSSSSQFELRIDLEDWAGNTRFAVYDTFDLGDESDGYRLHIGAYSGTARDALNSTQVHNGQMFTTFDKDNDPAMLRNCAVEFHGAWWYNKCHDSNLNGRYYVGGHTTDYATGLIWFPWKRHYYSLRKTAMKIREKSATGSQI